MVGRGAGGRQGVAGEGCSRGWVGHPGWLGLANAVTKKRGSVRSDRRSAERAGGVAVRRSRAEEAGGPRCTGWAWSL